jgi:hypothetical protein
MIDLAQQIGAINRRVVTATAQGTESVVVTGGAAVSGRARRRLVGPDRSRAGAPLVPAAVR